MTTNMLEELRVALWAPARARAELLRRLGGGHVGPVRQQPPDRQPGSSGCRWANSGRAAWRRGNRRLRPAHAAGRRQRPRRTSSSASPRPPVTTTIVGGRVLMERRALRSTSTRRGMNARARRAGKGFMATTCEHNLPSDPEAGQGSSKGSTVKLPRRPGPHAFLLLARRRRSSPSSGRRWKVRVRRGPRSTGWAASSAGSARARA